VLLVGVDQLGEGKIDIFDCAASHPLELPRQDELAVLVADAHRQNHHAVLIYVYNPSHVIDPRCLSTNLESSLLGSHLADLHHLLPSQLLPAHLNYLHRRHRQSVGDLHEGSDFGVLLETGQVLLCVFQVLLCVGDHLCLKHRYVLLGPVGRVKGDSTVLVLVRVAQDVDALEAATVSNGQTAVSLGAIVPAPYFAEDQAHSSGHCEGVDVQILLVLDSPVAFGPVGHPIGHGGSTVSHPCSEVFGAVEDPLCQSECDFRQFVLVLAPIDGESVLGGFGEELLHGHADVPEDVGLGGVGEGGMVLNLVDSPEAEVGGSHCFLAHGWQLHDWDIECPGSDLQHLQRRHLLHLP
jgi:hypothetical protein